MGELRPENERRFVSALGQEVRRIKERRKIPYSQVAKEAGVSLGRVNGLVSSYVLVKEDHEKMRRWVEDHA